MTAVDINNSVGVSIVMPCLNEAQTLKPCVEQAREALEMIAERYRLSGEVLVADNGSTDGSQEIARAAGARVVDVSERGYGAALLGGFAAAKGRYFVMGDSDQSYDFRDAVPMIGKLIDGADVCMGSRFKGEIKPGAMPWKNRYIGNPALSGILRLIYRTPISDSHCGLRALTADAFKDLKLSSTGMEFASEMVLKSSIKGLRIDEVPVTLHPDGRSRPPHLSPWRDGLRHLFYMLMLSPTWLFIGPAALLFVMGSLLFTLLIGNPDLELVRIGNFGFGDHWAIVAAACCILGHQAFIFGMVTMRVGLRNGYFQATSRTASLLRVSSLHAWLNLGLVTMLIGLIWAGIIATGWIQSDFGELDALRPLLATASLIVIGVQTCFAGFLLSVVSGNRINHGLAK